MSTKSQKTEDMLDQTFANFDTEVTGAETQQTQAGANQAKSGGAKKSNNMVVFVGVGVAAVGAAAYLFLKPQPEQQPMPNTAAVQPLAPAALPKQEEPKPAEIAPVTPPSDPLAQAQAGVDPLAQANQQPNAGANPTNPLDPLAQANQPATTNPTPVAPVDPLAQVNQAALNVPATPVTKTEVIAPTPVANPAPIKTEVATQHVAGANVQSVAVVDELKSMFDKQSNEFKTVLTDIDNRVGTLEGAVSQQKDINSKFDQRITALEGNKPAVAQVKKSSVAKSTVTHTKKKASVAKEQKNNDANVLLDKSSETKTKVEKVEKTEKVEKSSLPSVSLHSIYGGRLWIKNHDGSLSTFSVGEKLPSGEVIKEINDENFEVKTDKRVIKN